MTGGVAESIVTTRLDVLVLGPERIGLVAGAYPDQLREVLESRQLQVAAVRVLHRDAYEHVDLREAAPEATDLLILNSHVPTSAWTNLPALNRVVKIGRLRPGIDVAALAGCGIGYRQVADPASISVAEHALLLMLAAARRLGEALVPVGVTKPIGWPDPIVTTQSARLTNWLSLDASTFRLLAGSRLGIIGLGEIGFEIASRARALGMDVTYNNRNRLDPAFEAANGLRYESKSELVASCSFVVVSSTSGPGEPPALGVDEVQSLREDAIVVNVGRGSAVDEAALIARATSSPLGGLGLDVYMVEPVDPQEFAGCWNTYLTAHVASLIPPSLRFEAFADCVESLLAEPV